MTWPSWLKRFVAERPRLSRFIHGLIRGLVIQFRVQLLGVPVIAITGTNGKTTVALMLERVFREAGYRVGLSCTDGVMRDGQWIDRDDQAGMGGVWLSAKGGNVDVLVAETARGGMIRFGFAFRTCDVAVVTNISDDHLGIDGVNNVDEMADVKARLLQRLKAQGTAVLNADDQRVVNMAEKAPGSVIWFSREGRPAGGENSIYVSDGIIYRRVAGVDTPLIPADDVAITENGLLRYNQSNAMALLGITYCLRDVLPVADEVTMHVLRIAGRAPEERRFAFRLMDYHGTHILMTQSKNPVGFRYDTLSLSRLMSSLEYKLAVGLISAVGNRRPSFYREIAGLAAGACDHLMAVAPRDLYLRGRSKASLIAEFERGIPPLKRLASTDGDCGDIIDRISGSYPDRTLFVIFNAREQRGTRKILRDGRVLDLNTH